MSYDWLALEAVCNGLEAPPRTTLLTVNGTGVADPFGPGFPGDLARAVGDEKYLWQPIGYPADVFPMRRSINAGRAELVRQINRYPGPFVMSGYSQGGAVVSLTWRDDILNPNGQLHHRFDDVVAIINYGDPLRAPGVARGNVLAGQPVPKKLNGHVTGGIAGPDCLKPEETPDFFYSFANDGDLYASAPVGDDPWNNPTKVGSYQTLVYELVMDFTGGDILDFAVAAAEIMAQPLTTVLPLVQAIWGGLAFAVQGPRAPHWTYDVRPAVELLRSL